MSISNKYVVPQLIEKFNFNNQKTYNPPTGLDFPDEQLFTSFLVGFIDGDGSMGNRKNRCASISIELHESWLSQLNIWSNKLYEISSFRAGSRREKTKIFAKSYSYKKKKTAKLLLTNPYIVTWLKEQATNLRLPILSRKWQRIDMSYKDKHLKLVERIDNIFRFRSQGLSYEKIGMRLGVSKAMVGHIVRTCEHLHSPAETVQSCIKA